VVVSGAVDIVSAGLLGSLGAYCKGAPIRLIGASSPDLERSSGGSVARSRCSPCAMSTASPSPIHQTGALPARGLRFIANTGSMRGRSRPAPVRGRSPQVMSGQVRRLGGGARSCSTCSTGRGALIARARDIPPLRVQTIRVQITTAQTWRQGRTLSTRYSEGLQRDRHWMYIQSRAVSAHNLVFRTVGPGPTDAQGFHPEGELVGCRPRRSSCLDEA